MDASSMPHTPAQAEVPTVLVPKPAPISDDDWTPVEHWVKAALRRGKSANDAAPYRTAANASGHIIAQKSYL